ncbi:MAG: response regulator [Alphaproteobacteria bacterium]|uniref:Response regulator n=1 Tax=Candidatus Nitrobium versatile TaxID=2884831 RepID=A0A953J6G0_9BACT|nr:response regulator [Candidatus Nitrobium versatile]
MGIAKLDIAVLYVEDEQITREIVAEMLKRKVRILHVAADGEEGIKAYRRHQPDIVITDIRMPVRDGLSMTREIKEEDRETPVIVTSAHSDSGYLMESIDVGVDRYVLKPIDMGKLFSALDRCAGLVMLRRHVRQQNEERENLIRELREALARVKKLSGLIPICSSCKKIRDDSGYWNQIEAFIREHSDAEFTHGLCPECAKRLYPNYYKDK